MFKYVKALLFLLFSWSLVLPIQAQERKARSPLDPVYTRNSARDIFSKPIEKRQPKNTIFLRPKQAEEVEESQIQDPQVLPQQQDSGPTQQTAAKTATQSDVDTENLSPQELILREFGNPEEEFKVKAADSAPAPFKAMLEAIRIGDQKLAMKYAVQYTKYREELQRIQQEALAISGQAKVREGVLGPDSWPNSPNYKQYHYLQELDLEAPDEQGVKNEQRVGASGRRVDLLDKTQEILKRATSEEYDLFSDSPRKVEAIDSVTLELDEEAERRKARQLVGRLVPKDPQGKVQVLYFLDLKDKKVMGLADDIQRLHDSAKQSKVQFMAFTLNKRSYSSVATFKRITGAKFPIIDGTGFAKQIRITQSPTAVFVATSTGQSYIEEGIKNFYYLDEIMKMMQGA